MIFLPGAFKEHEPRYKPGSDIPVQVLGISVSKAHIGQYVNKIIINLIHDKRSVVPVLVEQINFRIKNNLIVVRHVTEYTDKPAVLIPPEETGNGTPVIVCLIGDYVTLHRLNPLQEEV